MNALLLPLMFRTPASTTTTADDHGVDVKSHLAGARIHLTTDHGLVDAWFLDATPRRDATVIPLGRGCWQHDVPTAPAMKRARMLLEDGVSVLLVDVRGCERWWARLLGRSPVAPMRSGLDYLVARGFDEDDCTADAW